jgi:hypothetical protein
VPASKTKTTRAVQSSRTKTATPKPRADQPAARKRKAGARAAAAKSKASVAKPAPRADYGAPIDGFFAKQPAHLRPILEELRKLVEATAPEAQSSLKWGMPFYTLRGEMLCALGGHKSHVNLVLAGPADAFVDPQGLLEGESKLGRHLKLKRLEDLPHDSIRTWLRAAVKLARAKASA